MLGEEPSDNPELDEYLITKTTKKLTVVKMMKKKKMKTL